MKRICTRLSAAFLFSFIMQYCLAQQLDSVMSVYEERFPTEKIHIHFDKSAYNKEETIWYKVYIMSGSDLSLISRNVYLEWYDTTGRMINQTVSPLYQSSAKGSFELPATYNGNFIHVKAYTRWMLNDDPAFSYERQLAINTQPAADFKKPVFVPRTKVELFPEGGFLVQGVSSRVAFKATNQFGNPVLIKGILVNDKNKTLDTLRVVHDGMGSFYLLPIAGETYKVNWTDENGKTGSTAMPVAKAQGVVMRLSTTNEKALVRVERSEGVPENMKQFNLVVHMNQAVFFKALLKGTDRLVQQAGIPIDELPTGILQFSLFSSDWIPVAERIIFVNNHLHEFNAKINPQVISVEKRGKTVLDIVVSDTAYANMSIAVTDASVPIPEHNTIFSDMLLSSEIKGKVYNPAYYLKSDADSITAALDLVMLTNGWRRFDWEKIKAGVLPTLKYPMETGMMKIGGKVLGMKSISTASPLMLNLIVVNKDSSKRFMFIPVQKDGSFEDNSVFFYDTARIFYSFNGNTKLTDVTQVQFDNGLLRQQYKKIEFGVRDPFTTWTDSLARTRMNFFLAQQEQLKRSMAATTLQEVIVKSRAKRDGNLQALEQRYVSGLFSGGDGYSFDLTEDPFSKSALDILSYLQGKVAGLMISGSGAQATLSWRGAVPDLFLNEMQSGVDVVQTVPVADIALVKVFRPPFFGSMGGGNGGAIAIYTRKGGDRGKGGADSKGLENTVLGGYSRFKEFYSPSYEKPADNFETDIRTTLYWNPYVLTNKKSPRARIQFYNNDISKKLQVVIEGVNGDGKMTRTVRILE